MKSVLALLPLLFSLNAKADLKPFISEQDKNKMLQILDEVCGDSWCEGQYEIDFKSMMCTNDGCTVNMDLDLGTEENFENNHAPRFFETSIYLKKTPAFLAQLSSDSFKHNFLTAAFSAEVDRAMDALSEKF